MKKFLTLIAIVAIAYFAIIKRVTVDAGEEAVIIKKPWFFGKRGVEEKTISTGTIWSVSSSEIKIIPLKVFSVEDSFDNLLTKDNIPVDFNMTFSFKYKRGEGATLVKEFGVNKEWYKSILLKPIHNSTEIAIKKELFDNLYHDENITRELTKDIIFGVKELIRKRAIPIKLIDVTISKISPPKELIESAIRRETEKDRVAFHKLRKEAEEAAALADKAYMIKMNMNPREYLKMKQIELDTKKLSNQRYAIDHAKDSNGSIKVQVDMGK